MGSTTSRSAAAPGVAQDERGRRLIARLALGTRLRSRREQLPEQHSGTTVARAVGWTPQFYGEIEHGTKSSDDVGAWLRVAEMLQLAPRKLLEEVWETRDHLGFPLPPEGDPLRAKVLDLAIELHGALGEPLP